MDYQGNVIRPPSEAGSIILQVTVGCSHNRCTFCGAYKTERFRVKEQQVIDNDLQYAAANYRSIHKVFLADGDVLILPQHRLTELFKKIRVKLPWVKRIRLYGNCKSIRTKSVTQLQELKDLGLDRIYLGLESGSDRILAKIKKGCCADQMIEAARLASAAQIFLSVTVLLGIGGHSHSKEHALDTAAILNQMAPRQIAALTYMPIPGTPLFDDIQRGKFELPKQTALLKELRIMIENIALQRTQFQANHASNYLPINCRLPKDKEMVLAQIDEAINGRIPLMPDYMRGL